MIVAVHHPYFFAYLGYYRLLAAADLFVVLDNTQFPKRGYVHRNVLLDRLDREKWLTLPIRKHRRNATVRELAFADIAPARMQAYRRQFPALGASRNGVDAWVERAFGPALESPFALIMASLYWVRDLLGYETPILFASELGIDPALSGEDRIIEILRCTGARAYLNAPGGRSLYNPERFSREHVDLLFLTRYTGSALSMLQRLSAESVDALRSEIGATCTWQE